MVKNDHFLPFLSNSEDQKSEIQNSFTSVKMKILQNLNDSFRAIGHYQDRILSDPVPGDSFSAAAVLKNAKTRNSFVSIKMRITKSAHLEISNFSAVTGSSRVPCVAVLVEN